MIRQKPMYTHRKKESVKEMLHDALKVFAPILIVAGIFGMLISVNQFAIAIKPSMDFDFLIHHSAKPGDHIEGRVLYTYGCFAESSVIYAEYGKKTGEKKNGYYYAVPSAGSVMILYVPLRYYDAMETLTEETFQYLNGGSEPQANAWINGYVMKNDSESLQRMLEEYLVSLGYTAQDIEDIGEVYLIKQDDMLYGMRNLFVGDTIVLVAGLVFLIVGKRKNMKNLSPEQEARMGNMLTQVFMDKKVIIKQIAICMAAGLALASLFYYFNSSEGYLEGSVILVYVAAVLFGLLPLTGSRKYIIFYEHGMKYSGEAFLYEESGYPEFQVIPQKDGSVTVYLKLKNRLVNVSNMKDFIEKYKRAYGVW